MNVQLHTHGRELWHTIPYLAETAKSRAIFYPGWCYNQSTGALLDERCGRFDSPGLVTLLGQRGKAISSRCCWNACLYSFHWSQLPRDISHRSRRLQDSSSFVGSYSKPSHLDLIPISHFRYENMIVQLRVLIGFVYFRWKWLWFYPDGF